MTKNELEEKVEEAPLINEAVELISNESIDSTHDETNRIASIKETPKEVAKDEPITTENKYEPVLMAKDELKDKVNDSVEEEQLINEVVKLISNESIYSTPDETNRIALTEEIPEEEATTEKKYEPILMTKNEPEEKVEEVPLINEAVELISNKSIDSTHDETNRIASIKETPKEVAKDEPITTEKKLIKQLIPEENETEKESDEEDKESQVTDVEFTDDLYEEDDELSNSVEELRDFLLSGKDNENIEIELLNEIEQFVQSLSKQPLVSNRLEEEEIKIQKEEIEPEIERLNSSSSNYLVYIMAGVVVAALSFGVTKFAKYKNFV